MSSFQEKKKDENVTRSSNGKAGYTCTDLDSVKFVVSVKICILFFFAYFQDKISEDEED